MYRRHAALIVILGLFIVTSRPALAKSLEVTPFVGAMIPANSLFLESGGGSYIRMQTHTAYGLSLSCPKKDKIGLEVVLGTGTGKMELVGGTTAFQLASTLFMADLRGRFRLLGSEQSHLAGVLGVGYTDFNLGIFDLAHETGQGTYIGRVTGIAGAEIHGSVSDQLRLNIGLVDRIHAPGVGLNVGSDGSRKTQNDLVATLGLTFPL
jgi:hypothetical protein